MTPEGKPKNNKKRVAVLLSILLLPSFFYLILGRGSHHYKPLPFVGPKEAPVTGKDTIYHSIPGFRLLDQHGKPFSNSDLEGNIYIANFFFSRCPSICPKMAGHLLDLQNKFANQPNLKIVSHTVDPLYDSVEVLAAYAKKVHAIPGTWTFLTGSKEEIYDLAFKGYFASAQRDELAPGGFLHSELVFIVDKQGRLRGSFDDEGNVIAGFDGTSTSEMKKLSDAIDNLLREELIVKENSREK